jgi:hypothetical protein
VLAGMLLLSALCCGISCSAYHPGLYSGYDILSPNEEVKKNPLSFTDDGNLIVNQAFILYVYELRQEIRYLRAKIAELEKK